MHCTVIGPNLHTSKIVTAISVSERLLEMAAFLYAGRFDAYLTLVLQSPFSYSYAKSSLICKKSRAIVNNADIGICLKIFTQRIVIMF